MEQNNLNFNNEINNSNNNSTVPTPSPVIINGEEVSTIPVQTTVGTYQAKVEPPTSYITPPPTTKINGEEVKVAIPNNSFDTNVKPIVVGSSRDIRTPKLSTPLPKLPKQLSSTHIFLGVIAVLISIFATYFITTSYMNQRTHQIQYNEDLIRQEVELELSSKIETELRTTITSELTGYYQTATNLFLERYEKDIARISSTVLNGGGVWDLQAFRCPETQIGQISCLTMNDVYVAFPEFTRNYIDGIENIMMINITGEGYLIYEPNSRSERINYNDLESVKILSAQENKIEYLVTHSYCKNGYENLCYNNFIVADEYLDYEEHKYTLVNQNGKWQVDELEFPY